MKAGKVVIFSAPSGSGKTTLVQWLLEQNLNLDFSVSATSRPPRKNEMDGNDYFFLTPADFRKKIDEDAFLEWEEVYTDKYYGTLKSEVGTMLELGRNVLLDVDVKGGLNIKRIYGEQAISIFIKPPGVEVLRKRLESRGTDSPEIINERIEKATWELGFATEFDVVIVNDDLEVAKAECLIQVKKFLNVERGKKGMASLKHP